MPNPQNVSGPLTLLSPPRSGTTLLSRVFGCHSEISSVGETENLIFYAWYSFESSRDKVPAPYRKGIWVSDDVCAGELVRNVFLSCFTDGKRFWFQKPNGIPTVLQHYGDQDWDSAARYFWRVMKHCFPDGRYFTVLRNPCDIVASGRSLWGFDEGGLWWTIAFLAYIVTHPESCVEYAVDFHDLVADSECTLRKLLEFLAVPFEPAMLDAFQKVHVPSKGRDTLSQVGSNRESEWKTLNRSFLKMKYRDQIDRLYGHFGKSLQWPEHLQLQEDSNRPGSVSASPPAVEPPEVAKVRNTMLQDFNRRFREIHDYHRLERRRAVRDAMRRIRALEDCIEGLRKRNEILKGQLKREAH